MKQLAHRVLLVLIGVVVGFAFGRSSAPQPKPIMAAVDCYDKAGNLVKDEWGEKFGAVRLTCPPGLEARLHQSR